MNATREQWRQVVGRDGYEVSDQGRIRSLDRIVHTANGQQRRYRGNTLQAWVRSDSGHHVVSLGHCDRRYVHTLVAEAFIGPRPAVGMECRHLNGDPSDNRPANLAWGTRSDQRLDDVRNGRNHNARRTHCRRGHEFTSVNTYVIPSTGSRQCRACDRANRTEKRKKKELK